MSTLLAQSEAPGPTSFQPRGLSACCILASSNPNPLAPTRHLPIFCVADLIIRPATSLGRGNPSVCGGGNLSCSQYMVWLQLWILPDGYPVVPALLIECRHENQFSTVRSVNSEMHTGTEKDVGRAGGPIPIHSMLTLDVSDRGEMAAPSHTCFLSVGLLSIYTWIPLS